MADYNENGQFNSALEMQELSKFMNLNNIDEDNYEEFIFNEINSSIKAKTKDKLLDIEMYFHIPFCESKCIYCPYVSIESNDSKKIDEYVHSLILEYNKCINAISYKNLKINSIYFGGGTPSMLSFDNFETIFKTINNYKLNFNNPLEICIEFLPSHVYKNNLAKNLANLINSTFNNPKIRFSIGVQSLDRTVNKIINRAHGIEEAKHAIDVLSDLHKNMSNFSFNVDLMIGLPEQNEKTILDDVIYLVTNKVPSISVDHTRILKNTILFTIKEKFNYLSESKILEVKKHIYEYLEQNNYSSIGKGNFLTWFLPGYRRVYKAGNPNRIAFGASAISDFPTLRYSNYDSISKYMIFSNEGKSPHELVTSLGLYDQIYMTLREQLRINGAIDINELNVNYNIDFEKEYFSSIETALNNKYMSKSNNKLFLESGYEMFDVLKFFNSRKNTSVVGALT